jgi:hypothetical protein
MPAKLEVVTMSRRSSIISFAFAISLGIGCRPADRNAEPAGTASPNEVTVIANEYAFQMPDTIPAGLTKFRLVDQGKEPHHLFVMKLEDGKKASDMFAALKAGPGGGPPPTWMHPVGGPNAPVAGGESNATLVLEAGEYAAFCVVPTPQGAPHFMLGMIRGFTVTPSAQPVAALPKADLTITLQDYDFVLSGPFTSGRHVIAITNSGTQPHEVVISRFAAGQSAAQFAAWGEKPGGKTVPGHPMGGTTDIPPGKTVVIEGDFPPGRYGFICFTRDKKDGKPHHEHGMLKEFTVQ